MSDFDKRLGECKLFKNFTEKEIINLLKNIKYKITSFSKNETIALEGYPLKNIGIILEGNIEVQKNFPSGKTVTISQMSAGNIFGEVAIFSKMNKYPSTIISINNSKVFFISKSDVINLCSTNKVFLNSFMELLSNKILMLNKKLKNLSYQTIREKIASYLIDEYKNQSNLKLKLQYSRKEMAEQFGTTRPSLSRELINMKNEGLIDYDKKIIIIKDLDKLEECLF
jgi:CRP-like cAMP-binding protein